MKEYYGVTMEWRSDIYSIRLSRVSLPRPGPPGVDIAGVVTCSLSIKPPPSESPYWEDDRVFVGEHTGMEEAFMYVCMYVSMDGWMDEWMDGWMDESIDRLID